MEANLERICEMIAARDCFMSGMEVGEIATQAKRTPSTIRSWILQVCGCACFSTVQSIRSRMQTERAEALRLQPEMVFA